jgi:hypothetical protein
MSDHTRLVWLIGLLLLAGLACAQAGEIVSPEEATVQAEGSSRIVSGTGSSDLVTSGPQVGDEAELTGSLIVNLQAGPGGRIIGGKERGATVTGLEIADHEDEIWYRIETSTGEGWVREDKLLPLEGAGGEDTGLEVGDTVRLKGVGFLVNLLSEPGGRIVAGQERGTEVDILEITTHEGQTWYRIDAPTGEGWVSEENIEPLVTEADQQEENGDLGPGDSAYLTGVGFLVTFLSELGGRIVAGQERGTEVTILEVTTHEGETWYLIDAPTGQGWVPADNITTEAP